MESKIQVLLVSLLLFSTMVYVAPGFIAASYQTLEEGTVYIRADGSVDPLTAPIHRDGDVYTLTGNISSAGDGVVIERNNMTLDGASYTLQGGSNATGIDLSGRSNVTIENFSIRLFKEGIHALSSSDNVIAGNEIKDGETGIKFVTSSNNAFVDNRISHAHLTPSGPLGHDIFYGIDISGDSPNNNITGNWISGRWGRYVGFYIDHVGISLSGSSVTTFVSRNNITNCTFAIEASGLGSTVSENNIENSETGIKLSSSSNNALVDNRISHAHLDPTPIGPFVADIFYGIDISGYSSNNNITGNWISGRWGTWVSSDISHVGIAFTSSPVSTLVFRNHVTNCTVAIGANGSGSGVSENNIENSGTGILFGSYVTVSNNTIRNNGLGIGFGFQSSFNTVTGNILEENGCGIKLEGNLLPSFPHWPSNNTISYNNITGNGLGIYLDQAPYNTFVGNHIKTNRIAVTIILSPHVTLRNNVIEGSQCNLFIDVYRMQISYLLMDIDESNSVDGKPIYYWVDQQHRTVPSDAGFVALINSTDITVEGIDERRNFYGIVLAHTNNSQIGRNNVTANQYGIFLWASFNNTIYENNVFNSTQVLPFSGARGDGIVFEECSNNTIFGNSISGSKYGIDAGWSPNSNIYQNEITNNHLGIISSTSLVHENHIANNDQGIESYGSEIYQNTIENNGIGIGGINNTIYHNNFINNSKQVGIDLFYRFTNIWDNGYLSGGNYWSDYTGVDADNDGFGDMPYVINRYNSDNYPLMKPWAPVHDVAVTGVVPLAIEVYAGQAVNVTVTVRNNGNLTETFTLMLKYQLEGIEHLIGTKKVIDLAPNSDATLTFMWATTDVTIHTLKAEAAVPGDVNVEDNTLISPATVKVRIMGDITDDNKVDTRDLAQAALSFGSYPGYPEWNPWADVNQDSRIDIRDLVLIAKNFGKQA